MHNKIKKWHYLVKWSTSWFCKNCYFSHCVHYTHQSSCFSTASIHWFHCASGRVCPLTIVLSQNSWPPLKLKCLFKVQSHWLSSVLINFLIRTAVIFYKADLSIIISDQVLQREETPAVCPYGDFTGQSQGFGGRFQQGHLVSVGLCLGAPEQLHHVWVFRIVIMGISRVSKCG